MTDKPADGAIASVQFIASAGTGKTHQVTSLYAALILGRPYPEEKLGPLKAGAVFDGATRGRSCGGFPAQLSPPSTPSASG